MVRRLFRGATNSIAKGAFALLAGWAAMPAGCASVEAEGTNWSCANDADCAGGKLCSRAFAPEGDAVVSAAKRCVAPDEAPVVLGVSGVNVEESWTAGVDGCVKRVNERLDGGDRVGGHPLRQRSRPYDLAAFKRGGPDDQVAKFLELVDAPDAASPRGPNSVDALYGFLQLHPDVARQLGAVSGKDVVLFGANDSDPAYRQPPPENLFFWRPSTVEEMAALVDSIFVSGVTDPRSVYITRWEEVSANVVDAFIFAWNNNKGRPVNAPLVSTVDDFGGHEEHRPELPTGEGVTYQQHVLIEVAEGFRTANAEVKLDAFLASRAGPLAVLVLDGPADAAGFLMAMHDRFNGSAATGGAKALDRELLGRLRFYTYSGASLMGTIVANVGTATDALRRTRVSGVAPDPNGLSSLAQAYQRDVLPERRSALGFESYLGCVYYVEALRESFRRHGDVESASLRQVLSDFTADIGLGPMSISSTENSASPTVYLYEYADGNPTAPGQRAVWDRDDGLR